jgi:SAM-dependent methyltransferase
MSENRNVLAEWRESAPYWKKHAATVRQLFAPISAALIRISDIGAAHRVLDIAGGAGEPSFEIARRVGAAGRVVYTDAVAEMVEVAARLAAPMAIDNIEFKRCAADSLPFDEASFDAVVSRLGAMFFDDVMRSLGEMLRVLKPAGRIALAVWSDRALNPFFSVITDVMARFIPSPPEDPDAPGAFRFAEPGKLAGLLARAGAADVEEHAVDFLIEAPLTPAEFWQLRSEISDSLRAKVAQLTADELARVRHEVAERLQAFYTAGRLRMPAQVLIISGNKP